jgi:hypothetical protein
MMAKQSDVFTVCFKWSPKISVGRVLLDEINRWYGCKLCEDDVEYSLLNIESVMGESIVNFRFRKMKISSADELRAIVFEQTGAVYIGFDIITNSFKYREPQRGLINDGELDVQGMAESIIKKNFVAYG